VLAQAKSVVGADIELHVAVAADLAVVEGVVLVEVAEGVDAGIAGSGPGGAVVGDHAVVEGVVRGVVVEGDAVVVGSAVARGQRVESVIAGGMDFDRAAISDGGIDGDIGDSAGGRAGDLKTESVHRGTLVEAGDGSTIDGSIALHPQVHGGAVDVAGARDGHVVPSQIEIRVSVESFVLDVLRGHALDSGLHDPEHVETVVGDARAIQSDVFHGDSGDRIQDFLSHCSVDRGVVGIVHSGADSDGVAGDGGDFEQLSAAAGDVAAGVVAGSD